MRYVLFSLYNILTNLSIGRGENGELRVGIRRFSRQPSTMPSSVISSQSMHLGVLATASHAVSTQTRFVVYYKPRYSLFVKAAIYAQFLTNGPIWIMLCFIFLRAIYFF